MEKDKRNIDKSTAIMGSIGVIAGIGLIFSGQTFIGISGAIASAMVALKGFGVSF